MRDNDVTAILTLLRQGDRTLSEEQISTEQGRDFVAFVRQMLAVLEQPRNLKKTGWAHCAPAELYQHFLEEVQEFQEVCDEMKQRGPNNGATTGDIARIATEGADIANMCMMLLAVWQRHRTEGMRKPESPTVQTRVNFLRILWSVFVDELNYFRALVITGQVVPTRSTRRDLLTVLYDLIDSGPLQDMKDNLEHVFQTGWGDDLARQPLPPPP